MFGPGDKDDDEPEHSEEYDQAVEDTYGSGGIAEGSTSGPREP